MSQSESAANSDIPLGRLTQVDLRDAWETEAGDFTPWLARDENILLLGEAIGLELEVEALERNVGPFRADILCKDTATGDRVLIENQLERTDHAHLGQLLTYAAGLETVTIVWISKKFTDEHRAALDWLNRITGAKFSFLGLEIQVWRIGNSQPAPKFNVVSQPNEWTQGVSDAAKSFNLTPTQQLQLEYWDSLAKHLASGSGSISPKKLSTS